MQPGVLSKSQLLDSLKVYLNNKNRLQPIIGLGSIIECVKVGTQNRDALYMCQVCVCRLSRADMRNHIMGSLHRFNYIKARHPHLVSERQDGFDLSKLAWPLMEVAGTLEREEGKGDVQVFEVGDAVYQKMATCSENDALALINSLRDGQDDPESYPETTSLHFPIKSQRIVLLAQKQKRSSEKSLEADGNSYKMSACTLKSPPTRTKVAQVKSEVWLKNIPTSPERSKSFLNDYTGTKPVIGLFRVDECRSEGGRSCCFLCHCCRIRSNKEDIIDHLTSSSHLVNYLMETHPEQVELLTADIEGNAQLLQSLAKKVEREEGRGELKVVNAPESLCLLLAGKSYHWCIKMLCSKWTHTNKKRIPIKGPIVNETSVRGLPEKSTVTLSKQGNRVTRRKMRKRVNTVFNVSLPITKGSLLLERMFFSKVGLPVSSASLSSDLDFIPPPESQIVDDELDCDTGSSAVSHVEHTSTCETSQLQEFDSGDTDAGQYTPGKNITVTLFQDVDGCVSDRVYFNQTKDITGTKDQEVCGEMKYNRRYGSQESQKFDEKWENEALQTQYEGQFPAGSHTPSYYSSYRHDEGYTEQWYNSSSEREVGTRVEGQLKDMSSDAIQQYYPQHLQNHYMASDNASPLMDSAGGHYRLSGEPIPVVDDAARINMQSHLEDSLSHGSIISPEAGGQSLTEQRGLQTYMEFPVDHVQPAPQSYVTQSTAYQASQVDYGLMSNPNQQIGAWTNSYQHLPHPLSSCGGSWGVTQSNFFIQPQQAPYYRANSDVHFRTTGLSGFMISEGGKGNTPFMFAFPSCNSENNATPY
ncbi:uncharacterized protein [Embiotoca jacksoni]|uniref:uncharacterized protein n=1 Tax=Embiotoca jacksoni TaxID=100190 RepID=UPI0037044DFE